jgi:hypothetical protein
MVLFIADPDERARQGYATMVRSVVDRRHFSFVTYVLNSNDNTSATNGWAVCSSRSASLKHGSCSAASRRC